MPYSRKITALVIFGILIAVLALFLPEITFTPKQYINASNITVVGAGATSGSLQNISDINQGYFNITEGNAQPFYAIVNFTGVTNFSFVEIKAKYFSSSGTPSSHTVDLEIYCTTDNEYEDLFFLENTDSWRYFTRHFPDDMHFIDNQGNVSIKFNHAANGNTNHRLWIDTVRLITSSQYEQININQTIIQGGGTGSQNLSQVLQQGNSAGSYNIDMNERNIQNLNSITETSGFNQVYTVYDTTTPTIRSRVYDGSISNYIEQFVDYTAFSKRISVDGDIAMNGNLTGCLNCGGNQNLSQVLTQGNDANNQSISNLRNINNYIALNYTTNTFKMNIPMTWINDSGVDVSNTVNTDHNLYAFMAAENQTSTNQDLISYMTVNNSGWPYFIGKRARGIITGGVAYPQGLQSFDLIMRFSVAGWQKNATAFSGSKATIDFYAADEWNSTSTPTYFSIQTTAVGSTTMTEKVRIWSNGNVTISSLAGVGNAYQCVDSAGTEYRGNPGC